NISNEYLRLMQRAKIKLSSLMQVAVLVFVALAGCGVNALSGLQFIENSFNFKARCRPDKRSASGIFNV
ncbi:TPA: hypothetical protein ACIX12_000875, partial [Escherichia coli]